MSAVPQGLTYLRVSLDGPARLHRAGRTEDTFTQELAPRSAYILAGEARTRWQHTLSPVKTLRYSITFRTVRPRT